MCFLRSSTLCLFEVQKKAQFTELCLFQVQTKAHFSEFLREFVCLFLHVQFWT